jgi:hypothetical protein
VKAYYWFLAVVSVCAAIVVVAPDLILFLAMISFSYAGALFIPLFFFLRVAPGLATVLVPAAILQVKVLPAVRGLRGSGEGAKGVFLSILIVLAVNAAVALAARQSALADLNALLAEDRIPDTPPSVSGSVGIVGLGRECPDLCQRLLLTGLADRVVLASDNSAPQVPAPDEYATIWRMERRDVCPKVELDSNSGTMNIPGEPKQELRAIRPVDLMNLEIAAGNCLIVEEASYGRPDFTILDVAVRQGPASGRTAAVIRHDGPGDVIIARETVASADVIGPLILPIPGFSLNGNSIGLLRRTVSSNPNTGIEPSDRFASFLTEIVGLDLALVTQESRNAVGDRVSALLDQPGPVPDSADPLIASYLRSFAFGTMTDATDQDILLRVLGRQEISLPHWTSDGLPRSAADNLEFYGKIADLTFARMPIAKRDFSTANAIDGILDRLPAEVVKARSETVLRLAADPAVRFLNSRIVSRLSELGAAAGPLLIDILQEPCPNRTDDRAACDDEAWRDQRYSAFEALARGGPVFAGLKPDLQALIDAGNLNTRPNLLALLCVGFSRDELKASLSGEVPNLDRYLASAIRDLESDGCQ